jgi:phosphohistidine phosphatase
MQLHLVHHGEALGPDVDPRRPLSPLGRTTTERLAAAAAERGVRPLAVWHSGKLRAKQTAEVFWKTCNPLAEFSAIKGLQPDDPPQWVADRLKGETRDILVAGHFPYLPRLLGLLLNVNDIRANFPLHGVVSLVTADTDAEWRELWRLDP